MEIGLVLVGKEVLEMKNMKTQIQSEIFTQKMKIFTILLHFGKNSLIHKLLI